MFIFVELTALYCGPEIRYKWFLKNVSDAIDNNMILITHECLVNQFEKFSEECSMRFYKQFNMRKVGKEEFEQLEVYSVPDVIFDRIYKKQKTTTAAMEYLYWDYDEELEKCFTEIVKQIKEKHPNEKIEGILNCVGTMANVKKLAEQCNCPVIPYVFSAIREVHGYKQTLYVSGLMPTIHCHDEYRKLYETYDSKALNFSVLTREEILSLLGKERNLQLLFLLNNTGKYEIGLMYGAQNVDCAIRSFKEEMITDDDLYDEAKKYYSRDEFIIRSHPMRLDNQGESRNHVQNDPVNFLLQCKRIGAIVSQTVIKAALWNRSAFLLSDAMAYSFLYEKDIKSERKMSIEDLNFLLFACFVPESCMFDVDYWRWRIANNPSANELIDYHIKVILKNLGYPEKILYGTDRFKNFLKGRGLSDADILQLNDKHENPVYGVLLSRWQVTYLDGSSKIYYRVNEWKEDSISSVLWLNEKVKEISVAPLDDVDGFVKLEKLYINEEPAAIYENQQYSYQAKGDYLNLSSYIDTEEVIYSVEIIWKKKDFEEYFERSRN